MTKENNEQLDLTEFVSPRVATLKEDGKCILIWVSAKYSTINLGQGFMNFPAPDFVKQACVEAVNNDINQYAPPRGLPRLRKALADSYSPLFKRELNPDTEILITTGANEAIYCVFAAFCNQGDEAIFIEPYFDQYLPNLEMNGGKPIYCPLRLNPDVKFDKKVSSQEWKVDIEELERKITPKTKILVFNTPYNPVGKIFTVDELQAIGDLAEKHNLIILSDEVYDRLYFSPAVHERIATLSNFWKRTITVGSAGKSFGVTGWRVGWLIAPENLITYALGAHSRICFCTNSPMQDAIASALDQSQTNNFFEIQKQEYKERRDYLMNALDELNLPYVIPDGSYFLLVNTDQLNIPKDSWDDVPQYIKDRGQNYQMCYWFAKNIGVTAIPCSEFYSENNAPIAANLIRLAFCKSMDVLEQAVERLQKLKQYIN